MGRGSWRTRGGGGKSWRGAESLGVCRTQGGPGRASARCHRSPSSPQRGRALAPTRARTHADSNAKMTPGAHHQPLYLPSAAVRGAGKTRTWCLCAHASTAAGPGADSPGGGGRSAARRPQRAPSAPTPAFRSPGPGPGPSALLLRPCPRPPAPTPAPARPHLPGAAPARPPAGCGKPRRPPLQGAGRRWPTPDSAARRQRGVTCDGARPIARGDRAAPANRRAASGAAPPSFSLLSPLSPRLAVLRGARPRDSSQPQAPGGGAAARARRPFGGGGALLSVLDCGV